MKTFFMLVTSSMLTLVTCACNSEEVNTPDKDGGIFIENVAEQNTARAIEIIDNAIKCYFPESGTSMTRYYNPYTKTNSTEIV